MIPSSPSQIVVIQEPVIGVPDSRAVGELYVFPTGVLEVFQDGIRMGGGVFDTCVPVEEVQ